MSGSTRGGAFLRGLSMIAVPTVAGATYATIISWSEPGLCSFLGFYSVRVFL